MTKQEQRIWDAAFGAYCAYMAAKCNAVPDDLEHTPKWAARVADGAVRSYRLATAPLERSDEGSGLGSIRY